VGDAAYQRGRPHQACPIKEKSDDPATIQQIRQLLRPFEYTKIDKIIDVIFTTAVDVESQQAAEDVEPPQEDSQEEYRQVRTAPDLLNAKRQEAVDAFAALKGKELVKRSRTLFWTPDKEFGVCCAVSKRYEGDYSRTGMRSIRNGMSSSRKARRAISFCRAWILVTHSPCRTRG